MPSKRKKRACKCSCKKNGRSKKNSHSSVDLSGHESKVAALFSKISNLLDLLIKVKIIVDTYNFMEASDLVHLIAHVAS